MLTACVVAAWPSRSREVSSDLAWFNPQPTLRTLLVFLDPVRVRTCQSLRIQGSISCDAHF